jgi:hypothetical protein
MNEMNPQRLSNDEIFIRTYKSACALKNEIRDRIRARKERNWDFCSIETRGPVITLTYKQPN